MTCKPILCLDFDGVIHSYTSGWKGPRAIVDPPVPGALEWIARALEHFEVCIYSSRSNAIGGRWAMRRWLVAQLCSLSLDYHDTPKWWRDIITQTAFADPWSDEVRRAAKKLVARIGFPKHKPPAFVTLDDRGLCFTGTFPSVASLLRFQPWHKLTGTSHVDD